VVAGRRREDRLGLTVHQARQDLLGEAEKCCSATRPSACSRHADVGGSPSGNGGPLVCDAGSFAPLLNKSEANRRGGR
jgi:hypothetical protein